MNAEKNCTELKRDVGIHVQCILNCHVVLISNLWESVNSKYDTDFCKIITNRSQKIVIKN